MSTQKYNLHSPSFFYFLFWVSYFSYFWFNVFELNPNGDLTIGQANMWADWALHFTLSNSMAIRELGEIIPSSSPLLLDANFSYPFLTNLLSALLIKTGLPMVAALIIPSFIFSLLLIFALYLFFYQLFKNPSIAVIASFIFLLNGGIGFYYFIQESLSSADIISYLLNPAKEVTHIQNEQIKWMSVINSLLLPQRALLMGFPLSLLALSQIISVFTLTKNKSDPLTQKPVSLVSLIPAALILGLMPIIHLHSFLAVFVILFCWMLADYKHLKIWLGFAVMVSIIALPLLYWMYFSHIQANHFSWHLGWMAKDFNLNWFVFWFKNWTIVPLLALLTWVLISFKQNLKIGTKSFALFLPFFLLFALVNLVSLQPWVWDNTKLLIWVSLGFSGLTAYFIHFISQVTKQQSCLSCLNKAIVSLLFIIIILSGSIDVYRNIRFDLHRYTLYNKTELQLAEWVKSNTAPKSIWLVSPKHNHWLFNLTGRQAVLTYTGWLWSHGLNYQQTEADVKTMFSQANSQLFKKYRVDYVILDQHAKNNLQAKTLLFVFKYRLVKKMGQYQIFKISSTQPNHADDHYQIGVGVKMKQ